MKFTIDRKTWRCGGCIGPNSHGKGRAYLLNSFGYKCCLGFICEQLGATKLLEIADPGEVDFREDNFLVKEGFGTNLTYEAIHINDNLNISNQEREKQLIELFAKEGIEIEFTGEY